MSSPALEAFLARLYTDQDSLDRFLADPAAEAGRSGLSDTEARSLAQVDRIGMRMAATSFAYKRSHQRLRRAGLQALFARVKAAFRRA